MSKKMWNKIFKSKSSSKQTKTNNKINNNKRCSIYEEYQQLNAATATATVLLSSEKQQQKVKSHNLQFASSKENATTPTTTTTTTTNDDTPLPIFQQTSTNLSPFHPPTTTTTSKPQSTFSKVVSTLTRSGGNGNAAKTKLPSSSKSKSELNTNEPPTTALTNATSRRSSQILIVVNKIVCADVDDETVDATIVDQAQWCRTAIAPMPSTPKSRLSVTTNPSVLHAKKHNNNSNSNIIAPTEDEPDPASYNTDDSNSLQLTPCPICSRTFNPVTLQKHVGICEKMTTKKRNIFDSSRQRREGTELATYPLPKGFGLPAAMTSSTVGGVAGGRHERGQSPNTQHVSSPLLSRKKSNDEFARNTTRTSMRKLSNSSNTGAGAGGPTTPTTPTAPATMPNSNFTRDRMRSSERSLAKRIQPPPAEQCPHCERCFGIKAYDRHVEWCKEKALQASIKITTKNEQNVAKERLEARTKYRAPCLKTKRSINRDKYSGFPGDENEESPKSVQNSTSIMSLSMTSSLTSERNAINSGDAANATASNSKNPEVTKSQQDFRLTGEQLETYGKKKRNKNIVLNAEQTHIEPVNELSKTLAAELDKLRQQDEYNDHSKDLLPPQKSDSHDLSTTLTLGVPKVGKSKSTTALVTAERKLSSKQKSHIKLKLGIEENALHTKQMLKESASMAALKTLSCMSLTQQKQAIFEMEMPTNATTSTAAAAAAATITKLPTTSSGTTLAATMHTKLETNPIKSPAICRPKRKKLVRQANSTSHSTPLKAIPLLKESIEIFGMPVMVLNSAGVGSTAADTSNVDNDKEIKIIKAPPNVPPLTRNRSFILSGLPGNYDPFLSAKRQLEELCSPTALAAKESNSSSPSPHSPTVQHNSQTHYTPSTTTTPSIPISPCTKMTTSLTLSSSTPLHSPSPLTPNNAQNRTLHTVSTNTKTTPPSNFRRTSSLRGPRRSPLLPSRPLFAQKHRPTIQRGLSDEGPISTNFLKPEEYDEMPVRSVCGNDFALTNSPRVVRRDTSLSNRKHNLKLNVNETATPAGLLIATAGAVTNSSDERLAATTASKYISKTDSLAVFLKYENELEKLNPSSETAPKGGTTSLPKPALEHTNSISNTPNVQSVQNLNSPVISKELKDKSNTLSKQNSAKNILLEPVESSAVEQQKSTVLLPTKPVVVPAQHSEKFTQATKKSNTENPVHNNKYGQLRLEPISKPGTPLSKPATPITKPMLSTPTLPLVGSVTHHQHRQQPINLNAIFSDVKPQTLGYNKERKLSSSSEYIDPKLINKCDNLPVNLTSGRVLKHSDSDSSERQRRNDTPSSSSASESSAPSTAATNVSSPFTKLLTLTAKVESTATTQPTQINHPSMPPPTQPSPMLSQRNSAEGRNLLKRKMRLGRNQFLYDASPEADSCSADDEANRSSVEYDETHFKPGAGFNTLSSQHQQQQHSIHPQSNMPIISPLPIFDDFDFEEFLSSFENDDEQFPLFKDCREFLMNRTSNKQRSTLKPNSNSSSHSNTNNNNNNNNNTNNNANNNNNRNVSQHFKHSSSQLQSPIAFVSNNHTHFQFPSITTNFTCPSLLTSPSTQSSFRSNSTLTDGPSKYSDLKPTSSNENFGITANDSHKKREIFISIETEQNEHGRSPISPASLRSMVGNPQAVVEVDAVDANDNKFSKIDDDEPLAPAATTLPTTTSSQLGGGISSRLSFENAHHLPNVQLNNAKNLIQKMQEDFRQLGEEVGANIRQAVVNNTTKQDNASLLYRDTVRPATSNAAGGISSAAARHHHQHHPSVDACVDSDDMSSLDGYPISSQSSRRGVGSKLSADSAYGSLSRQRSSELSTHRSLSRTRPSTANSATNTTIPTPMIDAATQHQQQQQQQQQQQLYKYSTMKSRSRQFSGSSSSGSDNSLPPIVCHNNLNNSNYQQQQQLSQLYNNGSNNNNNNSGSRYENLLNNNDNESSPLSSPTATTTVAGTTSATAATSPATTPFALSNSTSNQSMSASMKLSKFCHECGGKFVIEQAKFCMDCGVRRIVL